MTERMVPRCLPAGYQGMRRVIEVPDSHRQGVLDTAKIKALRGDVMMNAKAGPSHKILEVDPEETLVTDHRSPAQASGVNDQLSAKAMLEAPWNLCAMPLISPVRGLAARIQKGDCLIKTRTTEG